MKNLSLFLIIAVLIAAGCTQTVEPETVDLDAVKETVTKIADKYLDAWNSENLDVLTNMVTDDGMFFGTDPTELMDKKALLEMYAELFADTAVDYSYSIDTRKTKVAGNGSSAIVVEYITIGDWSSKMPLRQTSHIVKTEDNWKIDFISWGFIIRNEDVEKVNQALE